MKPLILIATLISTAAQAEYIDWGKQPTGKIRSDAYGPGIASDATGRPFRFKPGPLGATPRTRQTRPGYVDWGQQPLGEIRQDYYGPGIDADESGRPFHAEPGFPGDD